MALQASFLMTLSGWLFGIIFLEKPWGCPSLPSFFSPSLFIALINSSILLMLSLDAVLNFKEDIFLPFTSGGEGILSVVIRVSFIEIVTTNLLIRFVFIVQAKKLATLWGKLYKKNYEDAKQINFFKGMCENITVVLVSFVLNLTLAVLDGMPIGNNFNKSWLAPMGYIPFSLILVLFMIVPFVLPSACGFATVLGTLHHLKWVYKEYCKKIQGIMQQKQFAAEKEKRQEQRNCVLTPEMKKQLVEEFEEIQHMFELWDSSLGPILLVILSGGSLRLVASASKIFLKNKDMFIDLVLIKDVGHLVICGCQLYALEVGERMLMMFQNWRDKLQKEYTLLTTFYNKKEKEIEDLKDLYLMIKNWRWNLSASGFFDVDRSLAAGILSYMLSYTVILVQVKIATEGY